MSDTITNTGTISLQYNPLSFYIFTAATNTTAYLGNFKLGLSLAPSNTPLLGDQPNTSTAVTPPTSQASQTGGSISGSGSQSTNGTTSPPVSRSTSVSASTNVTAAGQTLGLTTKDSMSIDPSLTGLPPPAFVESSSTSVSFTLQNGAPTVPAGESNKTSLAQTAGIVGGTVGGVLLIIVILFFLWRSRRKRKLANIQILSTPPEFIDDGRPVTREEKYANQGSYDSSSSALAGRSTKTRDISRPNPTPPAAPPAPHSSPPTYYDVENYATFNQENRVTNRRNRDAEIGRLGEWANEHRQLISEELEGKLRRAGYSPSFNPDFMSRDVWVSMYGVSDDDIHVLRELYRR